MSKEEEKPKVVDKETEERMARFEATRVAKNNELAKALNFIIDTVGCKTHNGILH